MKISDLAGKKVAILGLGKTGKSVINALKKIGASLVVWDDSEVNRAEFADLVQDPKNWPFAELVALIVSPGVPLNFPAPHPVILLARQHNIKIISDIELFMNSNPGTYIGITGTNGKSTTTALTQHILKSCGRNSYMGGNIGAPILDLQVTGFDPIFVIEISSFQLDLLDQAQFNIAALTNITPDHLDRHGGMEGYLASKARVFKGADLGIIPSPEFSFLAKESRAELVSSSQESSENELQETLKRIHGDEHAAKNTFPQSFWPT